MWWRNVDPSRPDEWHVAYSLHGLGPSCPPLRAEEYRDALGWFARMWSPDVVARGLRHAASLPAPHGSPVDRRLLSVLAETWARYVAGEMR